LDPIKLRQVPVNFREREFQPEQLQHHTIPFLVHERKNMGAPFAEPIMLYVVASGWRVRWNVRARRFLIATKSEELAASKPMKSGRTSRVCALGLKALIQRGSSHRVAAGGQLFAAIATNSSPLFFQPLNSGPQPLSNFVLDFVLILIPIEGIQRLSRRVE
jgi:hypothetical protein